MRWILPPLLAFTGACRFTTPGPGNSPPVVTAVGIAPGVLDTAGTATATVSAGDPDGDAVRIGLTWYVDDVEAGTGETLGGEHFDKGQRVRVEAVAYDGHVESSVVASDTITVANSAPGAPVVAVGAVPEADGSESLSCAVAREGEDPDGDAITTRYAWDVDGVSFVPPADGSSGEGAAVVSAEDAARGRLWTCVATSHDGETEGPAGSDSLEFTEPAPGQYAFEKVMDIDSPADLAVLPDGTLLVATLLGDVHHVDPATAEDFGSVNLRAPDDLISIALDPRFGDGAHDFLYTWTNHTCVVTRYVLSLDPVAVTDARDIVTIACPRTPGHAGGDLLWWSGETAEPVLYLADGPTLDSDTQDGADPGQKLLAYAVADDGTVAPGVPDAPFENPFVVALGLRNAWRVVDCGAVLCVPDPGTTGWEEIDLYRSAGMNFGFPRVEGPGDGTFDEPAFAWDNDETTFIDDDRDGPGRAGFVNAPVAGVRVSGRGYGGRLDGVLLFGEIYDSWIRGLPVSAAGEPGDTVPLADLPFVLSMAETPDGTVYAAEMGGSLQRLILRADRARVGETGDRLSETPWADGGMAFTVRHPLWSNGADKRRLLQVPAGASIDTSDPERWVFPEGTRLYKDFEVEGAAVETRVIEKRDGRWIAGTYVWEGDDAYLTDGRRVDLTLVSGAPYTVPAEASCTVCHDATRGREWPLGVEPFQLGDEGLRAIAPALDAPPPPAPNVEGSANYVAVRGYLHGNCAYCHRPDGVAPRVSVVGIDLRYSAEDMGFSGVVAQYYHANPNLENGQPLVVPGDPDASALVEMMEGAEMPPLSLWAPDTAAIAEIREWIAGQVP